VKPRKLLTDSQYSAANLRETALDCGALQVIPYPKNQRKGVRGILRIDRKFRSHGSQRFRRAYKKRVAISEFLADSRTSPASRSII